MATIEQLETIIDQLHGDMTFREILDEGLNVLESGRRGHHDFIVKSNIRALKSGPNRGLCRVDGGVVVIFGKRNRAITSATVVRKGAKLKSALDALVLDLACSDE